MLDLVLAVLITTLSRRLAIGGGNHGQTDHKLKERQTVKLRFEVDQAECFRRGVDCPKSIVTIDVNPKDLPQDERDLIAKRLYGGIDVRPLSGKRGDEPCRIKALMPDYEALLIAVKADEDALKHYQETVSKAFSVVEESLVRTEKALNRNSLWDRL